MKKIKVILFFIVFVKVLLYAQIFNIDDNYIYDFAKILKETDRKSLNELLIKYNKITGIKFKIIIINSLKDYTDEDIVFENFIRNIFNSIKTDRQNTILFAITIKDRKLYYESGTQINESLTSLLSSIIDNKIIPYFKNEEYARGIYDGVRVFIRKTEKRQENNIKIPAEIFYLLMSFLIVFAGLFLIAKRKKRKVKIIEEFGKGAFTEWK